MVFQLLLPVALPVAAVAAITKFHLKGENLSKYDKKFPLHFNSDPNSKGLAEVREYLIEKFIKPAEENGTTIEKLSAKRERFEQGGLTRKFPSKFTRFTITDMGVPDMTGEWIQAKGADPDKRILYYHGGAYTVGSAISHRAITSQLSQRTGCTVCAVDYRLMPENPRSASIEDARAAYRWLLDNGPKGPAPIKKLAIAGDSAGGNLTLTTINWARDAGVRQADAIAVLSPGTDSAVTSPSIRGNFATDLMLQPLVGPLLKVPHWVLLWGSWKNTGYRPSDPAISPVYDHLENLPPILVQASETEMLRDDAVRYVAKAQAAGTDARLQLWNHMPHVFQIFDEMLPEAGDALQEIANFFAEHGVKK
jgi:acetyl esterase/lipase